MCPSGSIVRPKASGSPDFRSAFEVIDVDRDGRISGDDLRVFYSGFWRSSPGDYEEIIGMMISVADTNKDGFVEYDEFERLLKGYNGKMEGGCCGSKGGGLMEEVFKMMDKDGDGRLSYGDLKSYMEWAGFNASDDEIKAMIKLTGADDGIDGVSFDGLLKVFGC